MKRPAETWDPGPFAAMLTSGQMFLEQQKYEETIRHEK